MTSPLAATAMLATSMHAQPGVYALLLGSGVSTGAGIPTGWGVVADLVRKVAAQESPDTLPDAEADPECWWSEHHGDNLGYSSLLKALAPTAAARQGLLSGYFEPTDAEREEGIKTPSKAHHAIAQLVKRGQVRVIVTTNFDRLMEQALEAAGVAPQVISRPEAAAGMEPLAHSRATVIKLHGDYKDLGSLNTPEELAAYPRQWNTLLGQVLDDFGLVIAGWSGAWDTALVTLMQAAPNRRYPLYWDSRSSKGDVAARIVAARAGTVVPAAGADELFGELLSNVDALEQLAEAPLSTAMATARLKRFLPNPVHRIDLHDLVMDQVRRIAQMIADQPVIAPSGADGSWCEAVYARYLDAAQPLLHLLAAGVWHDEALVHSRLWIDVLQGLIDPGTGKITQSTTGLEQARLYPALLATSVMGLVALRRERESLLIELAERPRGRRQMGHGEPEVAGSLLHTQSVITADWVNQMPRWAEMRWIAPGSQLLKADLRATMQDWVPADDDYKALFDAYEYRCALIHTKQSTYPLFGEYIGDLRVTWGDDQVPRVERDFRQLAGTGDSNSPWVNYLGGAEELDAVISKLAEAMARYRQEGHWM